MNGWPRRLGGTRFFDFLNLALTMNKLGAPRLTKILIEAANDIVGPASLELLPGPSVPAEQTFLQAIEKYGSLVTTSVTIGRTDLAKKRLNEIIQQTQKIAASQVSVKLICYGQIAIAAGALKDATLSNWAASNALAIQIKDLDFLATTSMLDVANGAYVNSPAIGQHALQRAEKMVDIVGTDSERASSYSSIASMWAQFGEIRIRPADRSKKHVGRVHVEILRRNPERGDQVK